MSAVAKTLLVCLVLFATCPGPVAADTTTRPPVFGYYDPRTHVFTPAPTDVVARPAPQTTSPQSGTAAATIVRSGTVRITATVHLVSPIPSNAKFDTHVAIGVTDPSTAPPPSYSSTAEASAPSVTRSGSVLTVKAVIPYRFVYTVAADQMTVAFSILSYGGAYPMFSYKQPIEVPAEGADTAISVAAAL